MHERLHFPSTPILPSSHNCTPTSSLPFPPLLRHAPQVRSYTVQAQEEGQPEGAAYAGATGAAPGAPTAGGIKGTGGAGSAGAGAGGASGGSAGAGARDASAGSSGASGVSGGGWGKQVGVQSSCQIGGGWGAVQFGLANCCWVPFNVQQVGGKVALMLSSGVWSVDCMGCSPSNLLGSLLVFSVQEPEGDLEKTKRSPVAEHVLEPQME